VHFWKTGRIGELIFEGDCIIGHEAAGVVLKCGEGVTHLQPGVYLSQPSLDNIIQLLTDSS
jgi:D-arabinose 1-dehydrogenase-like Zn-dependent alcohol dehydrogenase